MGVSENICHNFTGINDSTLREGEQYNSSVFSLEDQINILKLLARIGVDTVEVGNPVVPEIYSDLSQLVRVKKRPPLMSHIRNSFKDYEAARSVGVDGVHVLCTSDPERLNLLHQTLSQHIDQMASIVTEAKSQDLQVRVSVEHGLEKKFYTDATKILHAADLLGVDRVQVADTRGVLFPWQIDNIISNLRQDITTEIGVHLHNDLYFAVANAFQALASGANWVDTTMLGVGERTGITPLSPFLAALFLLNPSISERYVLSSLTESDRQMAQILNMSVPHNLVTSETAFSHKAGIHINGINRQGTTVYEAFDPGLIGNERIIVTGSRISGKHK